MTDVSFQKTSKKTNIEIDVSFLNEIWDKIVEETNEKLVPPLFDEFVITVVSKNKIYEDMKNCLIQEQVITLNSDKQQAEKHINNAIKDMLNEVRYDLTETYYVKYTTATQLSIIYFDGLQHKKRVNIELEYKCDSSEYSVNIINFNKAHFEDAFDKSLSESENVQKILNSMLQTIRVVSHYMQTYNPTVEYKEARASALEHKKVKNHNKGYSQAIKLKSKITKYVINSENDKEHQKTIRKYRRLKQSWYVRGYYQHFGKERVLKYVPPRINYRSDKVKQTPSTKKYIIE